MNNIVYLTGETANNRQVETVRDNDVLSVLEGGRALCKEKFDAAQNSAPTFDTCGAYFPGDKISGNKICRFLESPIIKVKDCHYWFPSRALFCGDCHWAVADQTVPYRSVSSKRIPTLVEKNRKLILTPTRDFGELEVSGFTFTEGTTPYDEKVSEAVPVHDTIQTIHYN